MKYWLCLVALIATSIFAQNEKVYRVAIIGAGSAGLSAAHYIKQADPNADITIFEKEKNVGGNAIAIAATDPETSVAHFIDIGPQYISEGPWDQFIELLESCGLYHEDENHRFKGSFSISEGDSALFTSPKDGSKRGETIGNLLEFKNFFKASQEVYKNPQGDYPAHVGDWVAQMDLDPAFKQTIVLPFLAATLGTTVEQVKTVATREIVKLYAFQKMLKKSDFIVLNQSLGGTINKLGMQLMENGVHVLAGIEVISYFTNNYYATLAASDGEEHTFDFVVFAIHPYQASQLTRHEPSFDMISETLEQMQYFQTQIVIHRDSSFVNREAASFLNINVDKGNVTSSTMDLGVINPQWEGMYKSWMSNEDLARVAENELLIASHMYWHPLITPAFVEATLQLKALVQKEKGIYFAGAWSEGLETQETAIISGKKAAEKYMEFTRMKR